MKFISSFASGHKLPFQLVKELISALAYCSRPFVGCFHRVWGTQASAGVGGKTANGNSQ